MVKNKKQKLTSKSASFFCFLQDKFPRRFFLVRDISLQNSLLYSFFQDTDFPAWGKVEHRHNFLSCNGRLEVSYVVFFFYFLYFLGYIFKIFLEFLLLLCVFSGNISLAEREKVF